MLRVFCVYLLRVNAGYYLILVDFFIGDPLSKEKEKEEKYTLTKVWWWKGCLSKQIVIEFYYHLNGKFNLKYASRYFFRWFLNAYIFIATLSHLFFFSRNVESTTNADAKLKIAFELEILWSDRPLEETN